MLPSAQTPSWSYFLHGSRLTHARRQYIVKKACKAELSGHSFASERAQPLVVQASLQAQTNSTEIQVEPSELEERRQSHNAASTSQPASSREGKEALRAVDICHIHGLQAETHYEAAVQALQKALHEQSGQYTSYRSGVLRLEVPLPPGSSAMQWLRGQSAGTKPALRPALYFSPRRSSAPVTPGTLAAEAISAGTGAVAGVGAAWTWQGESGAALDEAAMRDIQAFLSESAPRIRALGGVRFDSTRTPAEEWNEFGSYLFMIPRLEYLEAGNCNLLACTLTWHADATTWGSFSSLSAAVLDAQCALDMLQSPAPESAPAMQVQRSGLTHLPDASGWEQMMQPVHDMLGASSSVTEMPHLGHVDPHMALQEYESNGQGGLDALLATLDGSSQAGSVADDGDLTKVVLARRSDISYQGQLDVFNLLQTLQDRDPRAFQLLLQLPSGATFLSSTPELLYERSGSCVASEAVAGTRAKGPPGDVEKDFWLAFDLLRSPKDHAEFSIVRDWVREALADICEEVSVDTEKSVLKQGAVQHLYGRLSGKLLPHCNDGHLLAVLHPTPAVCGRPREAAKEVVCKAEPFDRGMYAGPFGWISGGASEFAVAIRSALVHAPRLRSASYEKEQETGNGSNLASSPQQLISLFAGVGIVRGSDASSEWKELDLKIRQFETLLCQPPAFKDLPNINQLWARLMVEELCRLGINTFCIAPGSRSSPLTMAVAMQPTARIVPCIDERSLAFWAVGFGRAKRRPAVVITSSGTAVANLFPAVVEASQSRVPMLLLTADRPSELRDTGANQTIEQVKLFGSYTKWAVDLPPPDDNTPARMALTTVDTAARFAMQGGPVHLNCQFREPLGPRQETWSPKVLKGLLKWEASYAPFTLPVGNTYPASISGSDVRGLLADLLQQERGLVVAGEQMDPQEAVACFLIAKLLGWPLVADALSGLCVGAAHQQEVVCMRHLDHALLDQQLVWPAIRPKVVLQLGGRLTSKRTMQFLEWSALSDDSRAAEWMFVDPTPERHDAAHCIGRRIQMTPSDFAALLQKESHRLQEYPTAAPQTAYCSLLSQLEAAAASQVVTSLSDMSQLTEPFVAHEVARTLPPGNALFVGNSMPIRDVDAFGSSGERAVQHMAAAMAAAENHGLGAAIAANRGASGIDGIISTAAGFAFGLRRATTLLIGDVSFLHDVNGLSLLRTGEMRPPLTIVLVNNGGGGIFDFLPIAEEVPKEIFMQLWSTPQNVDLAGLCRAHGLAHQRVTQAAELVPALAAARGLNKHSIVEVITSREANVGHHREIQAAVKAAVLQALPRTVGSSEAGDPVILTATYRRYQLPLRKAVTTGDTNLSRQGLVVELELGRKGKREGHLGRGEIAPLPGLHKETLLQAEQQLILLCKLLPGNTVPLQGLERSQAEFSSWLQATVGVAVDSLFPSVTCGLEGAWLAAIASYQGTEFQGALGRSVPEQLRLPQVSVCGLLDCLGSPEECAEDAVRLVEQQGYAALKLKVARRSDPSEDAAVMLAIRQRVGPNIVLRADANRRWNLPQAVTFAAAAASASLQYLEEPLKDPKWLPSFFQATGMPIALDETLDESLPPGSIDNVPFKLKQLMDCGGIAAMVIKPAVVGGFSRSLRLAELAAQYKTQAVISSAFETSLALSQYAHLAAAIQHLQPGNTAVYHGLGTSAWFAADILRDSIFSIYSHSNISSVQDCSNSSTTCSSSSPSQDAANSSPRPHGTCEADTAGLKRSSIDLRAAQEASSSRKELLASAKVLVQPRRLQVRVETSCGRYDFRVLHWPRLAEASEQPVTAGAAKAGPSKTRQVPAIVFMHGFLGQADDWEPIAASLSLYRDCYAIDLPGHGNSTCNGVGSCTSSPYSISAVAAAISQLTADLQLPAASLLVAYSMGARVGLHMLCSSGNNSSGFSQAVIISGSGGIERKAERQARAAKDDTLAATLQNMGLAEFAKHWYSLPMWGPLSKHPRFLRVLGERSKGDAAALAAALAAASPGRTEPLLQQLCSLQTSLLLVAGALDNKYVTLGKEMAAKLQTESSSFVEVKGTGHAVHIERPEALLSLVYTFLSTGSV